MCFHSCPAGAPRHAVVGKILRQAPHASATHVAYNGIQPMLREMLMDEPSLIEKFAEHCKFVGRPTLAIQACGLSLHPEYQRCFEQTPNKGQLNKKYRPIICEIIYHMDTATQHQDLPSAVPGDGGNGGGGGGSSGGGHLGGKGTGVHDPSGAGGTGASSSSGGGASSAAPSASASVGAGARGSATPSLRLPLPGPPSPPPSPPPLGQQGERASW